MDKYRQKLFEMLNEQCKARVKVRKTKDILIYLDAEIVVRIDADALGATSDALKDKVVAEIARGMAEAELAKLDGHAESMAHPGGAYTAPISLSPKEQETAASITGSMPTAQVGLPPMKAGWHDPTPLDALFGQGKS